MELLAWNIASIKVIFMTYLAKSDRGLKTDSWCLICYIGASTFQGLRRYIADRSKTRVLAFLHIAQHGLAAAGCASGGMCVPERDTVGNPRYSSLETQDWKIHEFIYTRTTF